MKLAIQRTQKTKGSRTYCLSVKVEASKAEMDSITAYGISALTQEIGKIEGIWVGNYFVNFLKGFTYENSDVRIAIAIESQIKEDLATLKAYIKTAIGYSGTEELEI